MPLTEKQLHDKRRNKKLRRMKRKNEMTIEQIEDKEIAQMETMMTGQALWSKLVNALPQSDKFEELCRENNDTPSSSTSST